MDALGHGGQNGQLFLCEKSTPIIGGRSQRRQHKLARDFTPATRAARMDIGQGLLVPLQEGGHRLDGKIAARNQPQATAERGR
jgi:hypothetical protein